MNVGCGTWRRSSIVAACLIVLPLDLGTQGSKSLPARVSDQEFWKMVSDFADPSQMSAGFVYPAQKRRVRPAANLRITVFGADGAKHV